MSASAPGHRRRLGRLVRRHLSIGEEPVTIVFLGDLAKHAPVHTRAATVQVADPQAAGDGCDFSVAARLPATQGGGTLVIYVDIGFLWRWELVAADVEAALVGWRQVVIGLIRPGYEPLPLAGHEYLLSLLLSAFPRRRFDLGIDAYVPPAPGLRGRLADGWRGLRGRSSPTSLAALVVSIRRRARAATDPASSPSSS